MVTLVWSYEAIFKSFQRRSGQGPAKKYQILNIHKKVPTYLDQFFLRNPMVSIVLRTITRSYKNGI